MHSTEKKNKLRKSANLRQSLPTSLHNINFPDILELPDGDVEGAEGAGPPDARAAVHHDGRAQGVAGPGGLQTPHQLTLLLPDTLRGDRLGRVKR